MPDQEIIPAHIGRPSSFTQGTADIICERLALGESLRDICLNDDDMPSITTIYRWLMDPNRDDFREQYARARELQGDSAVDEMKEIADDGSNDWMEKRNADGQIIGWTINGEAVARSKLRIEDRKWRAAKLKPKVYGEKYDVTSDGKPIGQGNGEDAAARAAAMLAEASRRRNAEGNGK